MDKKALPFVPACQLLLDRFRQVWLQVDLDGHQNVWILKPGAKSRGRGWFRLSYVLYLYQCFLYGCDKVVYTSLFTKMNWQRNSNNN